MWEGRMLATIIVIAAVGYMLWRFSTLEKKIKPAPDDNYEKLVLSVLDAIRDLQVKGETDEEGARQLRQQRARLRAALRDSMTTEYGLRESIIRLEYLEETITRILNQVEQVEEAEATQ
jgi:hypothetical protein